MTTSPTQRPTQPQILAVESRSGGSLRLRCKVPADLAYLEGHFEAAPVVPGIAQIKWVAGAIRQYFGHELQLAGMEAVKFHQLLLPAQSFSLFIEADPARAKWRFQIEGERGKIASGRLLDRSPIKLEE